MAISLAEARSAPPASLPTYKTAAAVLENRTGSGIKLAGWTVARTVMIAPPFLLLGVPAKQAWGGAVLSSLMISGFTLLRILNGGQQLNGTKQAARSRRRRKLTRSR